MSTFEPQTDSFEQVSERLLFSAKLHRNALEQKRGMDNRTQQGHTSLWTFPQKRVTLEGFCGCNAVASYSYSFPIATFNQSSYERLKSDFEELHDYNVNEVFMSLYEQTVGELQLSRLIHDEIPRISSMVSRPLGTGGSLIRMIEQGLCLLPYSAPAGGTFQVASVSE